MTSLPRLSYFCLILSGIFLICAPAATSGQTSDAKGKAMGSISGRATIAGKAAPGIPVAAYGADAPIAASGRRAAAQAITDTDGRYRLLGLVSGTYQVMALAPNFASAEPISLSVVGPSSSLSKSIVLAPAENVEDIELKLVRGGVITGRIKDADAKPVVEQRIAIQPVDEKGAPARTPSALPFNPQMYQTDDRGVYRVYGLPAGHYKVSVGTDSSRGSMSGIGTHIYFPLTFFGDVSDTAKATVIELSEGGETANIDIQVGRRGETYSAIGRVIDADSGQPVAGIRFGYGPAPKTQPFFQSYSVGPATNANGEFRIEGLEPGRYGVSVNSDFESSSVYSDPAFFEVTDGDVSNLEVKAVRGLSLSGFVSTDGITNKDVLAQLTSSRVSASISSTGQPQTFNNGSSLIAGDGSFSINGLRPGRANFYISSVGNPGIRGLTISRVEREGVDVTRTLELRAGQSYSDLRVFLIYGTGTIRGTLKFENGVPPPGARVFVTARREGSSNNNLGAQPDARGRFVMTNLAAGTYEITINLGFPIGPQPGQRRPPPPKQFVTVADDAEAEVTFTIDLKPGEGGL